MKKCPVCGRSCADSTPTCPGCRWDFTHDLLTHPLANAPQKCDLSKFSMRLYEARSARRRSGYSALRGNRMAVLHRLLCALPLLGFYIGWIAPGAWWKSVLVGLFLALDALAALQWRRCDTRSSRFVAHALFPFSMGILAALLSDVLHAGDAMTFQRMTSAFGCGIYFLAGSALLVELLYYGTNRASLRPEMKGDVAVRAAFPRVQRRESTSWDKAEMLLSFAAVGTLLAIFVLWATGTVSFSSLDSLISTLKQISAR